MNLIELNPVVQYLPTNTKGRDFVVGDIHGCKHLFEQLMLEIKFDYANDRMISVGDLVDRGPQSKRCLDLLKEPWFHAVLANHEDLCRDTLVAFLLDHNAYNGPVIDFDRVRNQVETHINNGGSWLIDYFLSREIIEEKIAYCKDMIEQINKLPLVLSVGEGESRYNVVHSEICLWADVATDDKLDNHSDQFIRDDFVWSRNMFGYNKIATLRYPDNYQSKELSITYSGHTPVMNVTKIARQINIDTCAFYADFISVERNGEHGLTTVNPANFDFWTINGASKDITISNLKNEAYLGDF